MKFVSSLLKQHLQRYPRMELADIYKLLHQAATGAAHAATKSSTGAAHAASAIATARQALADEVREIAAGPAEPIIDLISPDGQLARVHLRAYVAAGHDIEALAQAFVATAQQRPPERDKLERFCGCLGDFAATGELAFDPERVRAYFAQIVAAGYPAVHHSDVYRSAYRPAYRVVQIDLLRI
jgi:hypothetical protein